MKLRDVKTLLKTMIENKTQVTPMLWGPHGVGKSAIVKQVADAVGYRLVVMILSQKEAVDVAGVLYTYQDETLGMSVTSAHPPIWFADALKNGKLILFMDEFNMARREVLNAAFELVLDRRLNNTKLPDDVFIICAGNPDDERYDVTPLSESLRDRLMHLKVESDTKDWLNWAEGDQVNSDVINFIKTQPKALRHHDSLDETFPVEIKHSNRSWERVATIHQLPLSTPIKTECFRGIIGLELATAFIKTLDRANLPLTVDDVLSGDDESLKKANKFATYQPMRIDLLTVTVDNLVSHLQDYSATAVEMQNTMKFIELLPEDLSSKALTHLAQLDGWFAVLKASPIVAKKIKTIASIKSVTKRVGGVK